jgi:RimJ/RimL family protein N-acetyltransferase
MWVEPVTLEGKVVSLEPLTEAHAAGLMAAAEPVVFNYVSIYPHEWTQAGFEDYVRRSLAVEARLPFAVILKETGQAIGTTSYMDIRPEHRGLEIGYTWIGRAYQGTTVNPECKYLLLGHAFETLGAVRVQLKTDGRNEQSQRAIARLGAKLEGVLRKHMILPDGYVRDTVMFSVIAEEWPAVKLGLERRLANLG